MAISQPTIDELLSPAGPLKQLLDEIALLRERVGKVEEGVAAARRDYERRLGDLIAEAARLEARRQMLHFQLEGRAAAPPPDPFAADVTPPPTLLPSGTAGLLVPPPLPENTRDRER